MDLRQPLCLKNTNAQTRRLDPSCSGVHETDMNDITRNPIGDKPKIILSAEQLRAVCTPGSVIVHAGAGAGKTTVLIHRVVYLIEQGCNPFDILVLTFSVKAAHEMRARLAQLLPYDQIRLVKVSTLHALGLQMMREFGDLRGYALGAGKPKLRVCSGRWQLDLVKQALMIDPSPADFERLVQGHATRDEINRIRHFYVPADVLRRISDWKYNACGAENYLLGFNSPEQIAFGLCFLTYQELLRRENLLDFDDLIMQPFWLLQEHDEARAFYQARWRHVLIDEFQDFSDTQCQLIDNLLGKQQHLTAIGDSNQSVYAFRGALGERSFERLQRSHLNAEVVYLPHNFRSSANIVMVSELMLANLARRQATIKGQGQPVVVLQSTSEHSEADRIANEIATFVDGGFAHYEDCAVLCRTHQQIKLIERALVRLQIPCAVKGKGQFFEHAEIAFLLACLRLSTDFMVEALALREVLDSHLWLSDNTRTKLHGDEAELHAEHLFEQSQTAKLMPTERQRLYDLQRFLLELNARKDDTPANIMAYVLSAEGCNYACALRAQPQGETLLERVNLLQQLANQHNRVAAFLDECALLSGEDPLSKVGRNRVQLMTIHQAKGLEFKLVFFVGLSDGQMPLHNSNLDEERRLAYVGCTRATDLLCLSYPQSVAGKRVRPSRFFNHLAHLPAHIVSRHMPIWAHCGVTA